MIDNFKLLEWYYSQGRSASKRRIEYLLTFDEWLKVWIDSGKLEQRGAKSGCYVMSRYNDTGPYSVENVKIILHEQNCGDVWLSKGDLLREKIGNALRGRAPPNKGIPHTAKTKEKMRLAHLGIKSECPIEHFQRLGRMNRGRKWTAEQRRNLSFIRQRNPRILSESTRLKMSIARSAYWERRRNENS